MTNGLVIIGIASFLLFSLLTIYAAIRGKTLVWVITLFFTAASASGVVYSIHLDALAPLAPVEQEFNAVNVKEYEEINSSRYEYANEQKPYNEKSTSNQSRLAGGTGITLSDAELAAAAVSSGNSANTSASLQ